MKESVPQEVRDHHNAATRARERNPAIANTFLAKDVSHGSPEVLGSEVEKFRKHDAIKTHTELATEYSWTTLRSELGQRN